MAAEEVEKLGYSRCSELLKEIGGEYMMEVERNALIDRRYEEEHNN